MPRFLTVLAAAALAALAAAPAAWAAKKALVIGNADYAELSDLNNTLGDARAYRDAFQALDFDVSYHENLDEIGFEDAISDFTQGLAPGDTAAFFYSGHGWSDGGVNYLAPIDAPRDGSLRLIKKRSVVLKNGFDGVVDAMRASGASLRLAIVDACRDYPFDSATRSGAQTRGLARVQADLGEFVIFSAGEGQVALDRLSSDAGSTQLSVFSRHFVPLLSQPIFLEDAISEAQVLTALDAQAEGYVQTPSYYDQTLGKTCLAADCGEGTRLAALPVEKEPEPADPVVQDEVSTPETFQFDPSKDYSLQIQIAGAGANGEIEIDLFEDVAPGHAERLATLAAQGAYDGVVFHRVIEGFMAQTGDVQFGKSGAEPGMAGRGGSELPDLKAEFSNIPYERGTVGMARAQDPDSANSQFFIMFAPGAFLNGQYTVIGEVTKGMKVVDSIKKGGGNNGAVTDPDVMARVQVLVDGT